MPRRYALFLPLCGIISTVRFGEIRNRRYREALGLCERIRSRHPGQADALHLTGVAQMSLGRADRAAAALARAGAADGRAP